MENLTPEELEILRDALYLYSVRAEVNGRKDLSDKAEAIARNLFEEE